MTLGWEWLAGHQLIGRCPACQYNASVADSNVFENHEENIGVV
jgi:hypothetical protein